MQKAPSSLSDAGLFTKSIVGLYQSKIRKTIKIPDKTASM
jgi:hypothetical protein